MMIAAPAWGLRRFVLVAVALFTSLGVAGAQEPAPTHHDVIRGTVIDSAGAPMAGADVIVTMAPDRSFQRAQTDAAGAYAITFEQGTGDYLVHAAAAGMQTFRKRITRSGNDSVFVVDVKLASITAQQLAAVTVQGRVPRPRRGPETGSDAGVGADEHVADGVIGAVPPELAGDFAAIAATVPGVTVTPKGLSVAGLGPEQNSTTLNGMAFSGTDLPRDALTTVRVSKSTYDPARGWFGGVQQEVELASGVVASMRHAHFTVDAPAFQYTDPVSVGLGQRFTNIQASLGGQGQFHLDRLDYNYGVQAGQRSADVASLANAPGDVLETAGIAPDSAARLLSTLATIGIPVSNLRPASLVTRNASFIGQIGSTPFDETTFREVRTTWQLLGYVKAVGSTSVGTSPTSAPGYSGTSSQKVLAAQAHLSTYLRDRYLTDTRSAFSINTRAVTPDLELPSGHVLTTSDLPDGSTGVTSLAFGGNGALAHDVRQWTWETSAETKFYERSRAAHRVKITADSRFDGERDIVGANALGSFAFSSIADVAANRPESFTRALSIPERHANVWNGFVAASDWWRVSDALQLLYGARIEGNRFLDAPAYNPAVEAAFGVRTDHVPNTVHLSPRVGFTWTRRGTAGSTQNPIGEFNYAPTGYLRGGIGEFRSFLSPALLTDASVLTGLPGGATTLTCIGPATPQPEWELYAASRATIPAQCASAAVPAAFSDAAPDVQLFDPDYTAPRSWRANLAYASMVGPLSYTLEGVYSLNVNQRGRTDVNFANVQHFVTSDEARPVFVTPESIVPGSGIVAASDARTTQSFGHVFDNVSNLRSESRQATLTLSPDPQALRGWFASLSYSLASKRSRLSGFDAATFGSPLQHAWSRGDLDARHQLLLQGGVTKQRVTVTFFGRAQSGLPFTPLVGGDVNGDGLLNDRAFVFDPAHTPDASLASATRALLASAQPTVRDCFARQLGRPAARNSCEGPWTVSLNAQIDTRITLPHSQRQAHVALALANPLGGLDQFLHGSANLRGWGSAALPDPILYNVRGFDAANNSFRYELNQRFGDTRPSATTLRTPFRLTLDVSFDLGTPYDQQFLARWLKPGRAGYPGRKLSSNDLVKRYNRVTPDPYAAILQESDSLLLSSPQVVALREADVRYRAARDSVLQSLANYLAGMGDEYAAREALRRQNQALDQVWELGHVDVRRTLPSILNTLQLRLLPYPASMLYAMDPNVKGLKMLSR